MSGAGRLEAFLAKLYVDATARERFLADPRGESERAGLSDVDVDAVEAIDRVGLEMMADSLRRKRQRTCDLKHVESGSDL